MRSDFHIESFAPVPADSRYRTLLRAFSSGEVVVRVYPLPGGEVLDELQLGSGEVSVDPITPAVRASGHQRVRVEVEFADGGGTEPPILGWAFISLTHNATQHVTTISPQAAGE